MKLLLTGTLAAAMGLTYAGHMAPKVGEILHPAPGTPQALGLAALTGQLALDTIAADSRAVPVQPVSLPPPVASEAVQAKETPRVRIVEAWADHSGRVFVRFGDGTVALALASGEFAEVQKAR